MICLLAKNILRVLIRSVTDEYTTVIKNKFHLIDRRDYHIPANKTDDTHVIKYLNSFSVNISYYNYLLIILHENI